jgi:fucokinase
MAIYQTKETQMKPTISLFLRQSYLDAWDDYKRSLSRPDFPLWDYVILTASNNAQAEAYRQQIEARQEKKLLPLKTKYVMLPDPHGLRIGSGGATLNALRYVAEQDKAKPFSGKRILVIHSGGDSKRVPQYSACGKLFSPVPRELPNGKRSTLFDEFMIGMSGVPSRIKEGMLVLSGDVLLLFNPLQIDAPSSGAAAISFKEEAETGKDHGVFQMDEQGSVGEFLHKQSVETLAARGAVNERGKVDIDTGAVLFSTDMLDDLYALIDTPEKFAAFVNEKARLSFYGDFLYPLASRSTLEQFYLEKPEGSFCEELHDCRTALWNRLCKYRMRLLRLSPAAFIHFGTTRELREMMTKEVEHFSFLDWKKCVSGNAAGNYAVNNAVVSRESVIGDACYLEDSHVHGASKIGSGSILSHVTVSGQEIPEDVVLHGLKQQDGRFVVRIYGVNDNPKGEGDASFLNTTVGAFAKRAGISLWSGSDRSLWRANLYPACDTMKGAVDAALNVYAIAQGKGDLQAWQEAERMSLCSSFNGADTQSLLEWETHLRKTVKVGRLLDTIRGGGTVEEACAVFHDATISPYQIRVLEEKAAEADSATRMRIYYYLGKILADQPEGETYTLRAFKEIHHTVLSGVIGLANRTMALHTPTKEDITVRLPLRVNWGGGWSDTPPYCNERGGTVLNAAILLNNDYPVEVQVKRLEGKHVVLESADMGTHGEFVHIADLQDCHNPFDPFSLHKAALIACGIIPREGGDLAEILDTVGGLYLSTQMHNVPKGSGLGTSSVLAGACVKALFEYFDIPHTDADLYDHAMCMEQIMSTGGGWQDQVGGMTPGIKYITSAAGARQELKVQHLELSDATKKELDDRFALIYTGQRRLARNLLRDVVGRYIGNNPDSLYALEEIQRVAAMMRFELERGNVDGFGKLLKDHWELSKKIDAGSTNTCIDQIFLAVDDLLDGKMICGAGGGGFLQVILKKGLPKEQLRERLHETFQDCGVDVWDCKIAW